MAEAFWLMVIGMTTVFAFLGVLVMLMQLSSWVVVTYLPEDEADEPEPSAHGLAEIAVIIAAIESQRRGG